MVERIQFTKPESMNLGISIGRSSEEIRKEIKRLEQEIDHKLSTYSNLSERIEQWTEEEMIGSTHKDATAAEIEILLEKLAELNKDLNETNTSTSILQHHRSRVEDYTQEFRRLKGNINKSWERAQLLNVGRKHDPQDRSSMEMLIRERGIIHSSQSMANDLVEHAKFAKEQLEDQQRLLAGSNSKLKGIGAQSTMMGNLLARIRLKKNRNTLIIASVIATCICFLLWYWWTTP